MTKIILDAKLAGTKKIVDMERSEPGEDILANTDMDQDKEMTDEASQEEYDLIEIVN